MLIGVFELLADARAADRQRQRRHRSLRDFWIAQADLDMATDRQAQPGGGPAAAAWRPLANLHAGGRTLSRRRSFDELLSAARRARACGRIGQQRWRWPRCPSRSSSKPDTMPPLVPNSGRPYNPVVTLNGWTLPWRMNNGVKEFHLVAEPVVREMAPGFKAHLWGLQRPEPGADDRGGRGDRVRIFVTNKLPELHQHALARPAPAQRHGRRHRPDQPGIPPGKTFVYEFVARRPGTFMYHPHADEMVQMAMGMMGFWITHPKAKHPLIDEVDRDFCSCSTPTTSIPAAPRPRS